MIVSIHQPSYFPWLGLLHKIANSDCYMVMDEVQLTDSAYQHRNLFLSSDGKVKYLTIPFNKKNYLHRRFRDIEITDQSWRIKHLNFLSNSYRKHPYFKEVFPVLEDFFSHEYPLLMDAVVASMRISLSFFKINTQIIFQSDMDYDDSLRKGELVVSLVRASGADQYLSGTGAKSYLDESSFPSDISLRYQTFSHPVFPQRIVAEFTPGLSCLDALFNLGIDGAGSLFEPKR